MTPSRTKNKWPNPANYKPVQTIRLVHSGAEYFDVLAALLDSATQVIHLQVYIFDPDETGQYISDALVRAAKRGVRVYVIADAFGSSNLDDAFLKNWQSAGVRFRCFGSFFARQTWRPGRRLHQKVCIVDHNAVLLGGINISNKYRGSHEDEPWLDFAVLLESGISRSVHALCEKRWRSKYATAPPNSSTPTALASAKVQLVRNDWINGHTQISTTYRSAIAQAQDEITIVASYFLPGLRIRRAITKATKRGVRVRVVLSQVSDVPVVKRAMNHLYGWLLRNKVEIYEWRPSVLHAKVMEIDGQWSTIGSYNLNHLSDYGSLELNVNILDREFALQLRKEIDDRIANHCATVVPEQLYQQKTRLGKALDWLSYYFTRLLQKILLYFTNGNGRQRSNTIERAR